MEDAGVKGTSFYDLGVPRLLVGALKRAGITVPTEIQSMVLRDALAGRDVCGKAKTGSGKTLAFGLPIAALCGRSADGRPSALILTPTRELANQVHETVDMLAGEMGLRAVAVYGGANMTQQINAIRSGVEIVTATPGRLIDLIERGAVDLSGINIIAVDEADRMADMGFLPQVEWVLRHTGRGSQVLLFSATLDGAVDVLIQRHMNDPAVHSTEDRAGGVEEMSHLFLLVHKMDRVKVAARIIGSHERTIVFARTKRGVDRLVGDLKDAGAKVGAIHGDLPQRIRERSLMRFAAGELSALVATDVAARGIHVDGIDAVVHYSVAEDHKTYLHRSGRTARAGRSGTAVTMFLWDEELEVRQLQRRLGMKEPLYEVFSNDDRLCDLKSFFG